jgi:hypothetical protein
MGGGGNLCAANCLVVIGGDTECLDSDWIRRLIAIFSFMAFVAESRVPELNRKIALYTAPMLVSSGEF